MDLLEDEYSSLVSKVAIEISAAGSGTGDLEIAQTVVKLGQNSKNVQEFNDRLSENGFSLRGSLAASLFRTIRRFLIFRKSSEASNVGVDSKIRIIREEPEFPDLRLYLEDTLTDLSFPKRSTRTIQEEREMLPTFRMREAIVANVNESRQIVIVGDPGSGKTTQIPQYLLAHARAGRMIACTQPSTEAVIMAAYRVAVELGCKVGETVGYSLRPGEWSGPETRINFMTECVLWDEITADPELSDYAVIMIDDAHERSITMDVVLGLIKNSLRLGAGFHLVVTTATMYQAQLLARYFFSCDIVQIPRPRFVLPVQVMSLKQPCRNPLLKALAIVLDIHIKESLGDILLFLSGQEEVKLVGHLLSHWARSLPPDHTKLIVLPVWRFLNCEIDPRVYKPTPAQTRKVVVTTGAAETSMAPVHGILYVIDTGLTERRMFDARQATDTVVVAPISRDSVYRRTMLAARTRLRRGTCFRLYTEAASRNKMSSTSEPEILTANPGTMVLRMMASGVTDIGNFDFINPPQPQRLADALRQLYYLGALDGGGVVTELGKDMAELPLDPPWSKTVVTGIESGCGSEVLSVVAMALAEPIFVRPRGYEAKADHSHRKLFRAEGDHLSWLDVYETWRSNDCCSEWCLENFINPKALLRAHTLINQLGSSIRGHRKWNIASNPEKTVTRIMKAITSGLFFYAARRNFLQDSYRTMVENHTVYIHPRSALYHQKPSWVIYNKLVRSGDIEYMVGVMSFDANWLAELVPRLPREKNGNSSND